MFTKLLKSSITQTLLKGSFITLILRIAIIVFGYIFIYVINNKYGNAFVGDFVFLQSFLFILSIICVLGFDTMSVKFVSSNSSNYQKINDYYNSIIKPIISLTAIIALIIYLFPYKISVLLNKPHLEIPIKKLSLSLLPLSMININCELFRGFKNMYAYSIYSRGFGMVLLMISVYIANQIDIIDKITIYNLYTYCFFVIAIISSYHIKYLLNKNNNNTNINNEKNKKNLFSHFFSTSKSMLIISLVFIVFQSVDILMLGFLDTSENVGIYAIILKVSSVCSIFLAAINSIAGPLISKAFSEKNLTNLNSYMISMVRISVILSIPLLLFIIIFSSNILNVFDISSYDYKNALIIMSLAQFINVCFGSVGLISQMTGHERQFRNIIIFSMFINFILNFILIPKYHVWGAVYSSSFSLILWNLLGVILIKRKIKIHSFIH